MTGAGAARAAGVRRGGPARPVRGPGSSFRSVRPAVPRRTDGRRSGRPRRTGRGNRRETAVSGHLHLWARHHRARPAGIPAGHRRTGRPSASAGPGTRAGERKETGR
ncbi:hypothetical protein ADZ36_30340 [Streptomyces fradiae]|uniref:Uncharacterized protein n=1 Tax=Streptomyces fradiae TaxID=1906 RepID=A0ACC4W383_STRFR|nr:hypothetical protein ADZ36_30340 [Streptomyces fradiae]OFA47520.1 hypothetical protein BEN35_20455 [Streptomyces fradiae]PQM21813.1 hypothetical protein Sfr7A_19455 [Streptomyces xinghaiensis]